jgi:hypothetical protein
VSLERPVPVDPTMYEACPNIDPQNRNSTTAPGSYRVYSLLNSSVRPINVPHDGVFGANADRVGGCPAHLNQAALPARSIRLIDEVGEHIFNATVDNDALLDRDHGDPSV